MREGAKALGGLLLAALLLWWVFRDQDLAAVGAALGRASIAMLCLGALLNLGHNVFRVWRWGAILEPVRAGVPFHPMFTAVILGYMTTWIVPGRLGELVRPALLSAREGVPLGPCLGTVISDRLLDGAAIVFLFATGVFLVRPQGEAAEHLTLIRNSALLLVALVAAPLVALVAASAVRERLSRWVETRSGVVRWTGRTFLSLAQGTDALRRPSLFLKIVTLSLLAWMTIALGTWIGVRASGANVPFGAILVLLPLLALGVALPTPGGAGGYHAAMAFGLQYLFGVPKEIALGAGILMHLAITLPILLLGFALLRVDRIAWRDLLAAARQLRTLGASTGAPNPSPVGGTP